MADLELIKTLRDKTGVSVAQCKKALEEAGGDMDKALEILRAQSGAAAEKKADRAIGAGLVSAYIHNNGQVGSLVVLGCETDFVAKNPEFKMLGDDLAMQVAAFMPQTIEELAALPFIKDSNLTVADAITAAVQKFGERVAVVEFKRLAVGE